MKLNQLISKGSHTNDSKMKYLAKFQALKEETSEIRNKLSELDTEMKTHGEKFQSPKIQNVMQALFQVKKKKNRKDMNALYHLNQVVDDTSLESLFAYHESNLKKLNQE